MIKKILILLVASTITQYSIAQTKIDTTKQSELKKEDNKTSLTDEKKQKLEQFLSNASYQDFFEEVKKSNFKDDEYISFLLSKKDEGHVPLYWLTADYYAIKNNPQETHKWLYISLIMTQQDSYLCSDVTARNAPRILLRSFPKTSELTRKTPQYIDESMKEVIFFIYNIKNRIEPSWVCNYGDVGVNPGNNILSEKSTWKQKRDEVFKRFTNKYMK